MAADRPARAPRVLSRRIACTNAVWNVYFSHVSDGSAEVEDYLVVEPKARADGGITGVAVLPVVDGKIGLVSVGRVALDRIFDEAPKGFVEPGEDVRDAALRELAEETGLTCDPADLVDLGCVAPEPSTFAGRLRLYGALRCRPCGGVLDPEIGLGGLTFLARDDVRARAEDGRIEDGATLVAIFRLLAAMVRRAPMG